MTGESERKAELKGLIADLQAHWALIAGRIRLLDDSHYGALVQSTLAAFPALESDYHTLTRFLRELADCHR